MYRNSSSNCACSNNKNYSSFDDCKRKNLCTVSSSGALEMTLNETRESSDRSEHLVYLMTHVCSQKLTGIFRTPGKGSECCGREPIDDHHLGHAFEDERPKSRAFDMKSLKPPPDCSPPAHTALTTNSQLHPCACRLNQISKSRYYKSSDWRSSSHSRDKEKQQRRTRRLNYTLLPSWAPAGYPLCWGHGLTSTYSNKKALKLHFYALAILLLTVFARVTESCSSRSTPKPRPASPTLRPNVTFQTYACPPAYAAWYCLNGATCFTVKIQDAILYNCECAEGYMGPRCEFKDLDGSYLPKSQRVLLETASIAGGACIAILLVFTILFTMYVFISKDRQKKRAMDDPFNDQRSLQDGPGEKSQWPEYVYTVSNYLTKGYWKPFYAKDSPSVYHLGIEVPSNSKPIIEVRQMTCGSCTNLGTSDISGDVGCDRHTQRLISVIVPK